MEAREATKKTAPKKTAPKRVATKRRAAKRRVTKKAKGSAVSKTVKSKRAVNKAALVRGLPSLPAKGVVEALAKKGVKVTESYVYNVRAMARKKAGGRGAVRATKKFSVPGGASRVTIEAIGGGGGGGGGGHAAPGPVTVEELLMAAAAEMGLSRAITLLYSAQTVITKALGVRASSRAHTT